MGQTFFFSYWAEDVSKQKNAISYKVTLSSNRMIFMSDHFFGGKCLIPAAMLAEAMLDAAYSLWDGDAEPTVTFDSLDIYHGLQVCDNDEVSVRICSEVHERNGTRTAFTAKIVGDMKNLKGTIIRKNIIFSEAKIILDPAKPDIGKIHNHDESFIRYSLGKERYYKCFTTHKYLFQSITGNIKMAVDRTALVCEFEIGDKEDGYSTVQGLRFHISPLGFDSILQTAVCLSVFSVFENQDIIYTKVPIGIKNLQIFKSFSGCTKYFCRVESIKNSLDIMELSATIYDSAGEIAGVVDKIVLKKAPFLGLEYSDIKKLLNMRDEVKKSVFEI